MRLVNHTTLRSQPPETVFYFVKDGMELEGPCIKTSDPNHDIQNGTFSYLDLGRLSAEEFDTSEEQDTYYRRVKAGNPMTFDDELTPDLRAISVDKNHAHEQMFMLLKHSDVVALLERLDTAQAALAPKEPEPESNFVNDPNGPPFKKLEALPARRRGRLLQVIYEACSLPTPTLEDPNWKLLFTTYAEKYVESLEADGLLDPRFTKEDLRRENIRLMFALAQDPKPATNTLWAVLEMLEVELLEVREDPVAGPEAAFRKKGESQIHIFFI